MGASYEVWIGSQIGQRMWPCYNIYNLTASKQLNGFGQFGMYLPNNLSPTLLQRDMMIQVWRRPHGHAPSLWNTYFLRGWKFTKSKGQDRVYLYGPDIMYAISGRIAAGYANTAYSSKTDHAGDMILNIVSEANTYVTFPPTTYHPYDRAIGNLQIATATGLGPSIDKGFAWEPLLTEKGNGGIIQEIADAAYTQSGKELWFGTVPLGITPRELIYEFRVWESEIVDVSPNIIFTESRGNISNISWEEDYRDEVTYAYGLGPGEEALRIVWQEYATTRLLASIWNRREAAVDARNYKEHLAEVAAQARARLVEGQPSRKFETAILDTNGHRLGVDWDVGSRVTCESSYLTYTPVITGASIQFSRGQEKIGAKMEYESDIYW